MDHYPILPWIGGKRRLLPQIMELMPPHQCYCEAFIGGGAVFWAKPLSDVEVINDFNGELVNLYRVVQVHPEELVRQFKYALSSRQVFEWEKAKRPETLTDIQRAARFLYLQREAFGGRVAGQSWGTATTSPPRLNLMRIEEDLSQAHLRLSGVYIEQGTWADVAKRYDRPHTLHYWDPPYWQTEGYGVEFGWEQYEQMAAFAAGCQGMVILSINDHPDIRQVFAGMNLQEVAITYTVGGGSNAAPARELILWNDHTEQARRPSGTRPLF